MSKEEKIEVLRAHANGERDRLFEREREGATLLLVTADELEEKGSIVAMRNCCRAAAMTFGHLGNVAAGRERYDVARLMYVAARGAWIRAEESPGFTHRREISACDRMIELLSLDDRADAIRLAWREARESSGLR